MKIADKVANVAMVLVSVVFICALFVLVYGSFHHEVPKHVDPVSAPKPIEYITKYEFDLYKSVLEDTVIRHEAINKRLDKIQTEINLLNTRQRTVIRVENGSIISTAESLGSISVSCDSCVIDRKGIDK